MKVVLNKLDKKRSIIFNSGKITYAKVLAGVISAMNSTHKANEKYIAKL